MTSARWTWLLCRNVVVAGVLLGAVQWLKRGDLQYGVEFGLLWGVITGVLFTGAQYRHWRNRAACALCEELPERQDDRK